MIPERCDILIIGSGVMGLATGITLLDARPNLKVVIAEKESDLAIHASGRNSGVLHAGFYYSPESLKARFCRNGNREIRMLAKRYQIEVQSVGKVVVAKNAEEGERLDELLSGGLENDVELELLPERDLPKFEPLAKTFERFLCSPSTAISNTRLVVNAMRKEFESRNGSIVFYSSKNSLHKLNHKDCWVIDCLDLVNSDLNLKLIERKLVDRQTHSLFLTAISRKEKSFLSHWLKEKLINSNREIASVSMFKNYWVESLARALNWVVIKRGFHSRFSLLILFPISLGVGIVLQFLLKKVIFLGWKKTLDSNKCLIAWVQLGD